MILTRNYKKNINLDLGSPAIKLPNSPNMYPPTLTMFSWHAGACRAYAEVVEFLGKREREVNVICYKIDIYYQIKNNILVTIYRAGYFIKFIKKMY